MKKALKSSLSKNSYRLDNRSQRQFNKDILQATEHEKDLLAKWVKILSTDLKKKINYRDNGCGNDGRPLEISEVSTDADFIVDEIGLVEVKFSKTVCKSHFHLKVSQVNSYIKQDATILMVNGSMTSEPVYIVLNSKSLEKLKDKYEIVNFSGFGFKEAYKIPVKDYIWKKLI